MPIPPPESWEDAVPPYGIRKAKPNAPAAKIPVALERIALDVTAALADFGLPPVVSSATVVAGSQAARDAYWGVPTTPATRRALQNRGATTVRTDTGATERYFAGTADDGANPAGMPVAGWYAIASAPLPMAAPTGLASGWAAESSHRFVLSGAFVVASISLRRSAAIGDGTTAGTVVNVGFRPKTAQAGPGMASVGGAAQPCVFTLTPAGVLTVYSPGAGNQKFDASIVYERA